MNKNYYYILGINSNASLEEIKKAYRKLSLKFHPDKNDGDKFFEERFKDIQEAYETLIDDNQRRFYDTKFANNQSDSEIKYKNFEDQIKSEYEKMKNEKERLKKEKEEFEKEKQRFKAENEINNTKKHIKETINESNNVKRNKYNYIGYGLIILLVVSISIFFISNYLNTKDNSFEPNVSEIAIDSRIEENIISEVDNNTHKIENMILVEGGEFEMGSNSKFQDEKPKHNVFVKSFYIDKYEVTVKQFKQFVDETNYKTNAELLGSNYIFDNNYYFTEQPNINWRHDEYGNLIDIYSEDSLRPVLRIDWSDATEYCKWSEMRLPTEAEWEFAASGGKFSNNFIYSGSNNLDEIANYGSGKVTRVGMLLPNELGIYDMTGNLYEWCNDYYDFDYYKISPANNPTGPLSGNLLAWNSEQNKNISKSGTTNNFRVYRGGSCMYYQEDLRIRNRGRTYYNETAIKVLTGFRCVKDI